MQLPLTSLRRPSATGSVQSDAHSAASSSEASRRVLLLPNHHGGAVLGGHSGYVSSAGTSTSGLPSPVPPLSLPPAGKEVDGFAAAPSPPHQQHQQQQAQLITVPAASFSPATASSDVISSSANTSFAGTVGQLPDLSLRLEGVPQQQLQEEERPFRSLPIASALNDISAVSIVPPYGSGSGGSGDHAQGEAAMVIPGSPTMVHVPSDCHHNTSVSILHHLTSSPPGSSASGGEERGSEFRRVHTGMHAPVAAANNNAVAAAPGPSAASEVSLQSGSQPEGGDNPSSSSSSSSFMTMRLDFDV